MVKTNSKSKQMSTVNFKTVVSNRNIVILAKTNKICPISLIQVNKKLNVKLIQIPLRV